MQFLKIEVGNPVQVEIISGPTYVESQFGRKPEYILSVGGNSMSFGATDNFMSKIEQFRATNGNKMVFGKVTWGGNKTKYEVYSVDGERYPQGSTLSATNPQVTKQPYKGGTPRNDTGQIQGLCDHVSSRIVSAFVIKGDIKTIEDAYKTMQLLSQRWFEYRTGAEPTPKEPSPPLPEFVSAKMPWEEEVAKALEEPAPVPPKKKPVEDLPFS